MVGNAAEGVVWPRTAWELEKRTEMIYEAETVTKGPNDQSSRMAVSDMLESGLADFKLLGRVWKVLGWPETDWSRGA